MNFLYTTDYSLHFLFIFAEFKPDNKLKIALSVQIEMKLHSVKRKLLIVDDDDATRILVHEILESGSLIIIEACTGKEGLYLFKKHSKELELVFLDIKLPDCMGWDLIEQFRIENSQIPIVALSATNPLELKENYKNAGFDSYLSKPFDIVELERIVESYLKHQTESA